MTDVFNVSCLFSWSPSTVGSLLCLNSTRNSRRSEIISHFRPGTGPVRSGVAQCCPVQWIVTPVPWYFWLIQFKRKVGRWKAAGSLWWMNLELKEVRRLEKLENWIYLNWINGSDDIKVRRHAVVKIMRNFKLHRNYFETIGLFDNMLCSPLNGNFFLLWYSGNCSFPPTACSERMLNFCL